MTGWRCRAYAWFRERRRVPGWVLRRVRRHRRRCRACRRLDVEEAAIVRALEDVELPPAPSARLWRDIEAGLEARERLAGLASGVGGRGTAVDGSGAQGWLPARSRALAGLAAMTLVAAAGLGLGIFQARRSTPAAMSSRPASPSRGVARPEGGATTLPDSLTVVPLNLDVGSYVDELAEERSPQRFWRAYRASDLTAEAPLEDLDFRPRIPDELPGGLRLQERKMLRDACCPTLQLRYRDNGRWVDLFECHADHPVSFGRASVRSISVDGIACSALEWDDVRGRSLVHEGLNLVLVGNLAESELDRIVMQLGRGAGGAGGAGQRDGGGAGGTGRGTE